MAVARVHWNAKQHVHLVAVSEHAPVPPIPSESATEDCHQPMFSTGEIAAFTSSERLLHCS